MAFDIETVNNTIINYVADVRNAMPIDRAFLFGSYAKGTATDNSDIDICFFSRDFESQPTIDVMKKLFRLTRKYKGIDIEPRGFPVSEMNYARPKGRGIWCGFYPSTVPRCICLYSFP